jgi:hypothetical protein
MTYIFSEPWLLFVAVAALLFACSSVGYELSKRTHINDVAHHHEQISGLRDGLFVLLGLLLGFTIAMVLPVLTSDRNSWLKKRMQSAQR